MSKEKVEGKRGKEKIWEEEKEKGENERKEGKDG